MTVAAARVAKTFRDHEMLEDDDLSEDYENDAYFQDFDEGYRYLGGGGAHEGDGGEGDIEEEKVVEDGNKYGLNLDGEALQN
jgi:hypothetical protein